MMQRRKPFEAPNFTIKELRESIPKHCFERSLLWSSAYLLRDLILIGILGYSAYQIPFLPFAPLRLAAWIAYWIAQGIVMTGVWVIAHECGHQAFSEFKWVNGNAHV